MTLTKAVRRITTVDIAREAGVSRATVSHVLNRHSTKYTPDTEARVVAAMKALNYRPSIGGRSLATGRSDFLVLVMPNASFSFRMQDAIDEVVERAGALGVSVLIRFAGADEKSTVDALHYLSPVAVMDLGGLGASERAELEGLGVSVIPSSRSVAEHDYEGPDTAIGEVQVKALLATKARLAFALLDDDHGTGRYADARVAAVKRACQSRGLPEPSIIRVALTVESAANALASLGDAPLGVACYNDDVASAVVAGAAKLGRRVPDDIAVVGVDVSPLGQMLIPPLTSVRVNVPMSMNRNLLELTTLLRGTQPDDSVGDGIADFAGLHVGGTA